MELKDLVPPVELCSEIPEGKFADSGLVWCKDEDGLELVMPREIAKFEKDGIPAPTLQEIMLALDEAGFFSPTCYRKANTWCVDCEDDPIDEEASKLPCLFDAEDRDNAATAALKLWLEVNKPDMPDRTNRKRRKQMKTEERKIEKREGE